VLLDNFSMRMPFQTNQIALFAGLESTKAELA
jgi:hypothetical protein